MLVINDPTVRFIRFSGWAMTEGVQQVAIQSREVEMTNPARTIVDCFRYRNKIGVDIAVEGLREAIQQRQCTPDQLWNYAQKARVWSVMHPHVDTVVARAS